MESGRVATAGSQSDRVVVVTGASRGLGRSVSLRLAKEGYRVAALARSGEKLQYLESQDVGPGELVGLTCDVTQSGDVDAAFAAVQERLGTPDVLINNAGVIMNQSICDVSEGAWDEAIAVNMKGVFLCTQAAARVMIPARKGHIINVGSTLGVSSSPNLSVYCATKWGLMGFSDALQKELRPHRVKVTVFCPGSFTDSGEPVPPGREYAMGSDDLADLLVHIVETPNSLLVGRVMVWPNDERYPGAIAR